MKLIKCAIVALATIGLVTLGIVPDTSFAQESCTCAHCKKQTPCTKVCHLVCEEKKIEITCWGCEREEFCVPGPSIPKCDHCKEFNCSCEVGLKQKVTSKPKPFCWTNWLPGGASVRSRKKLMKRTETQTVPSHKWVVEDLCGECKQQIADAKSN